MAFTPSGKGPAPFRVVELVAGARDEPVRLGILDHLRCPDHAAASIVAADDRKISPSGRCLACEHR